MGVGESLLPGTVGDLHEAVWSMDSKWDMMESSAQPPSRKLKNNKFTRTASLVCVPHCIIV